MEASLTLPLHTFPLRKILDADVVTSKCDHNICIPTCSFSKLPLFHQKVELIFPPFNLEQVFMNRLHEKLAAWTPRLGYIRWQWLMLCSHFEDTHTRNPKSPYKMSIYQEATKQDRLCMYRNQIEIQRGVWRSPTALAAPAPNHCVFSVQVSDIWANKPLQWCQCQPPSDCNLTETVTQKCYTKMLLNFQPTETVRVNKELFFL